MRLLLALPCFAAALFAAGCNNAQSPLLPPPSPPSIEEANKLQRELFKKGVEKVTDGVYAAIGYGLANSIMLEGTDGIIVVDALESHSQAEEVLAAYREITDKPVKAVVLTHNHADHIFGSAVFTGGDAGITVYAHASTPEHIDRVVSIISNATYTRSMRMFGQMLAEADMPHSGIGPGLKYKPEEMALARPTHTFEDTLEVEVAGVRMQLMHAPGETPDQIIVWLPDARVLIPADNVYQAFPNLYTIRGTSYRDVMEWVNSIDMMRDLQPEYLVPCHTRPIYGADKVMDVLTAYRDAIQYVHDQTIRGLNAGKTPDELAAEIRLPPHLEQHPWLQPYYGTVPWSVRGIYDGYLGWFDGDGSTLEPLPPDERAKRMSDALAAGKPLAEQAKAAREAKDFAWGAELAAHWRRLEPESTEAKETLAGCYEGIAAAHPSANGRNYLLTQAAELRGQIEIAPPDKTALPDEFLAGLPIERFMMALPVRLKAEEVLETDEVAVFTFTDVGESYTIHIRRGVAEVRKRAAADADITVSTSTETFKKLAAGKIGGAGALLGGDLEVDGGVLALSSFMGHFEDK